MARHSRPQPSKVSAHALRKWCQRLRKADGHSLVVLEGVRSISEAIEHARTPPLVLFVDQKRLYNPSFQPILRFTARLRKKTLFTVDTAAMSRLTHVKTPPGILACWRHKPRQSWPPDPQGTYAYFYCIRDPGNLGTIFRTALATGIHGILLSPGSVSVYNAKVTRSSMSAILRVPFWTGIHPEQIVRLHHDTHIPLLTVHTSKATNMYRMRFPPRTIFLFGGETEGLPPIFRSLPGFHIPMIAPMDSLNTAMAASLVFYEHFRRVHIVSR